MNPQNGPDSKAGVFATTHWSVVFAARDGDSTVALGAMESLCRDYWRPVYSFVRRSGVAAEDAQDLTQEFFGKFIEKEWIAHLQDHRGRFRSFVLTFLKHFLSDARDRAGALKRGGGMRFMSLDEIQDEESHTFEPAETLTPDQVFERRWAQTLMERAVARLREQYMSEGKGALFEALKDVEPGERGEVTYEGIGAKLGMSAGAIKSSMHRMRLRHRECLRREIALTVGGAEDVDEEIQHLMLALGR